MSEKKTTDYNSMCRDLQECLEMGKDADHPYVAFSCYTTVNVGIERDGSDWIIEDILDDVAIQGEDLVFHAPTWGEGKDYESDPVTNPTWRDIMKMFQRAVAVTGDRHHYFLEGIHVDPKSGKVRFLTGS